MRDHHLLHTPRKEHHQITNRRTTPSSEQSKRPPKVANNCLDSVSSPGSEDAMIESPKDAIDVSPIFEVSDENQFCKSLEKYVPSSSPDVSSSVAPAVSDLFLLSSITSNLSPCSSMIHSTMSPSSSTITSCKMQAGDVSVNGGTSELSTAVKRGSLKAEAVVKNFRQAGTEVSNSNDTILLSKSILNTLLKIVIEELTDFPEEINWLTDIVEKKVLHVLRKVFRIILASMLIILVMAGVIFYNPDVQRSGNLQFPT